VDTGHDSFYAMAPFSTDPKFITASIELLYFYDVGSGKSTAVPLDWENGIGADVSATSDGFVAGLAAGHRFEVVALHGDQFQRHHDVEANVA